MPRFLILYPKLSEDDDTAYDRYEALVRDCAALLATLNIEGISSADAWAQWGCRVGMRTWPAECAKGFQGPGAPRYHGFVNLDPLMGFATEQILFLAAQAGKPVYLFERGGFLPITGIQMVNPEVWTYGRSRCLTD